MCKEGQPPAAVSASKHILLQGTALVDQTLPCMETRDGVYRAFQQGMVQHPLSLHTRLPCCCRSHVTAALLHAARFLIVLYLLVLARHLQPACSWSRRVTRAAVALQAARNAREAQLLMPPHFTAANGYSQPGGQPHDGATHHHNIGDHHSNGRTHHHSDGEHRMAPLDMQVDPRHVQGGHQARASTDSAASTLSDIRFSMDAASMGRSSQDAGTNGGTGFRGGFAPSHSLDGGHRTPGGPTGGAPFLPGSPSAFGTLGSSLFAFRGA